LNADPADSDRAAQLADDLSQGGFSDWFFPSIDELNQMYVNLKAQSVGGFSNDLYWSSSEGNNPTQAWIQRFSDGMKGGENDKEIPCRVRAIRSF